MNISTGGPHILLFERDQQLTALLISEFQLAGYECHTARTAVEVFDTIARYPIRLVLVNLAQAAAARREFWVALDTQRRGRGVQILTFHCTNLAGYGVRDSEDRSQTTLADMEVDGMLGLMNLVDAVRTRVPGVGSTTNTLPRIAKTPVAVSTTIAQVSPSPQGPSSPSPSIPSPAIVYSTQTTGKQPVITANGHATPGSGASYAGSSLDTQGNRGDRVLDEHTMSQQFSSIAGQLPAATSQSTAPSSSGGATGGQSYTEKIRAVLYPNQRAANARSSATTMREAPRPAYETQGTSQVSTETSTMGSPAPLSDTSMPQHPTHGYREAEEQPESSLAQLSRMVQEHRSTLVEESKNSSPSQVSEQTNVQILRTSPIEDIPVERALGRQATDGGRRSDGQPRIQHGPQSLPQATSTAPLASLSTPSLSSPSISLTSLASQPTELEIEDYTEEDKGEPTGPLPTEDVEKTDHENDDSTPAEQEGQVQEAGTASGNVSLFDIMQSLPPMPPAQTSPLPQQPSPRPQSQGISGRAIRSLGSVLLEGHLVPQSRLEVAQNIQRLLRGVDLSYQLGEILLMFKLLTPDQLLAASLLSHGLITTQQIAALGRIRQELHAIGLEYDLESLLILFRLLTPEQLREVRSNWQG